MKKLRAFIDELLKFAVIVMVCTIAMLAFAPTGQGDPTDVASARKSDI
jgi:hypothetical protein